MREKPALRALEYMAIEPGTLVTDIQIDRVFIGSCTNSRLEDLLEYFNCRKGKKVSPKVRAMVVPGSQQVKINAEKLGIDKVFKDAGFEWRESGSSMCLGMNSDILSPGDRCAIILQIGILRDAKEVAEEHTSLAQLWQPLQQLRVTS